MHEQPQNVKSVSLVAETCNFLSLLYATVNNEYINLVAELLDTMTEFIQV